MIDERRFRDAEGDLISAALKDMGDVPPLAAWRARTGGRGADGSSPRWLRLAAVAGGLATLTTLAAWVGVEIGNGINQGNRESKGEDEMNAAKVLAVASSLALAEVAPAEDVTYHWESDTSAKTISNVGSDGLVRWKFSINSKIQTVCGVKGAEVSGLLTEATAPSPLDFTGCKYGDYDIVSLAYTTLYGSDRKYHRDNVTELIIPEVRKIANILQDAKRISRVVAPKLEVTSGGNSIANGPFSNCTNLTEVCVPSLTNICKGCFHYCPRLTHVECSPQVQTMGDGAFALITKNKISGVEITFPYTESTSAILPDAHELPALKTLGENCFQGRLMTGKYSFPALEKIGKACFTSFDVTSSSNVYPKITHIDAPKCLTVEAKAFYNAMSLKQVSMEALLNTTSGGSGSTAYQGVFAYCYRLESFYAPNLTNICNGCFYMCTNLVDASKFCISNVASIGQEAFYWHNRNNTTQSLPLGLPQDLPKLQSIGAKAFNKRILTGNFNFPLLGSIGTEAFNYSFDGGSTVTNTFTAPVCSEIGEKAFVMARTLGTVTLGGDIKRLPASALADVLPGAKIYFPSASPTQVVYNAIYSYINQSNQNDPKNKLYPQVFVKDVNAWQTASEFAASSEVADNKKTSSYNYPGKHAKGLIGRFVNWKQDYEAWLVAMPSGTVIFMR